jgi:hypothetical protein
MISYPQPNREQSEMRRTEVKGGDETAKSHAKESAP